MLPIVALLPVVGLAATDPASAYIRGPAANTLGAYAHALSMAPPGSESWEILASFTCASAQDLLTRSGWVETPDPTIVELTGTASLLIERLDPVVGCPMPEVELTLPPRAPDDAVSLLGRPLDLTALSPQSEGREDPRHGEARRPRKPKSTDKGRKP